MKKEYIQHIFKTLTALLLPVVVCSCSEDEVIIKHGNTLPQGKYPLVFTTTVDGMKTRAADSEPWVDGDEIAVQIDDYPVIGYYKLNTDGSVKKCDDPLSWPYERGVVKAWFPSYELPVTKIITDQSEGYHDIDFLYAASGEERYSNTIDLEFSHKMTKVCCKLIKGDGVTEEDLKTAKIRYYGIPTVKFSEAGVEGIGAPAYITPASDFSALFAPQDVSELPFITLDLILTINDARIPKTLVYTPEAGKLQLEAGKAYTFNIKVQKDRLEVQTISGAWTESLDNTEPTADKYHIYLTEDTGDFGDLEFSSNVTEISADTRAWSGRCLEVLGDYFTISYKTTATNCHLGIVFANNTTGNEVKRTYYEKKQNSENTTDNTSGDSANGYYEFSYKLVSQIGDSVVLKKGEHVEVGDYLYNDGKWGGVPEKIYSQGEKTPVGIVFKAGAGGDSQHNTLDVPTNYGWTDNREIRGYAVALNDASTGRLNWGPRNGTLDVVVDYSDNNIVNLKYSGITATKNAQNKGIKNYPAFEAVIDYPTSAPEGSSGWYLPSYRQLTDIRNLFKHPQRRELITKVGGKIFYQETKYRYCSATERSGTAIWLQGFVYTESFSANTGTTVNKNYGYFARGVLTF